MSHKKEKPLILEAIPLFLNKHIKLAELKEDLIICLLTGLIQSAIYIFLNKKLKKIEKKINQTRIQPQLNARDLRQLHKSNMNGEYFNKHGYLIPQITQYNNKLTEFKNVFVLGKLNNQEGDLHMITVDTNIQSRKYQFINSNISIDGCPVDTQQHKYIKTSNYFSGLRLPILGSFVLARIIQNNQRVCVKCTAIVTDGTIRLTNVVAIGSSFIELQRFLIEQYKFKQETITEKQSLLKFGMGLALCYATYKILIYWAHNILLSNLESEFPGIQDCKQNFRQVYFKRKPNVNYINCQNCNERKINFIFVPCYHMQSCQQCFQKQNQLECFACNANRYCGIPIYTSN